MSGARAACSSSHCSPGCRMGEEEEKMASARPSPGRGAKSESRRVELSPALIRRRCLRSSMDICPLNFDAVHGPAHHLSRPIFHPFGVCSRGDNQDRRATTRKTALLALLVVNFATAGAHLLAIAIPCASPTISIHLGCWTGPCMSQRSSL